MRWLAFVLAVLALPLGAAACGDEDDDSSGDNAEGATLPTGDVRVAQIAGLAGLATNAFASAGADTDGALNRIVEDILKAVLEGDDTWGGLGIKTVFESDRKGQDQKDVKVGVAVVRFLIHYRKQ